MSSIFDSKEVFAQCDFSSLGCTAVPDVENSPLSDYHDFMNVKRTESGDSMKSASSCGADVETFRPADVIPNDAYELIQNWGLSLTGHHEVDSTVDLMDFEQVIDSKVYEALYEPMRIMKSPSPPKRFYRTVWRSLTQRIYQLEKRRNLNRAVKP